MSAEQFRDALGALTGQWYSMPAAPLDVVAEAPAIKNAKWIWNEPSAAQDAPVATLYLRKQIVVKEAPSQAFVVAACDNSFTLYINGEKAASGKDWGKPEVVNIGKFLLKGTNLFAVKAVNEPPAAKDKTDKAPPEAGANPAGFLLQARLGKQHRKWNRRVA